MPRKKRSASPFELMDDDFDDNSSQSSRNGNPPIQRNAANARERARMRVLSSAFGRLKTKLPNIPADTKLSKLDTLRLATMYIKQLKSVVEGGTGGSSPTTNGEIIEGSLNTNGNDATNCYLNLNTGVQSMNWPFGFHHHLSNSSLIRSSSANNLINNNTSHNNNNNNWCQSDNPNEEQIKHVRYDNENYEHHHHHQQQQQQQTTTTTSYMHHHTSLNQPNNHNSQNNHWYSETPSPELDSTSSTCLTFENSHLQHRTEHHHHPQLHNNNHHHHHHNMSHIPPVTTAHSSTFHLQHDFHHQPSSTSSHHHHLQQNRFVNSSNFQSTSIR